MGKKQVIKIAFIGGGGADWVPKLMRDIIFKEGLNAYRLDVRLIDTHAGRLEAMRALLSSKLEEWKVDWVTISTTTELSAGLRGADFVLIAITTGGLQAMRWDLEIPERYGIYHTVGDTCGPGGWSRALRNIPVFHQFALQIKDLAPDAFVLNYTNPLGVLTNVLARELGDHRVVGLCHGLYETYQILKTIFKVKEPDIRIRFGGLNHFFWVLDFEIGGKDGYELLRKQMKGRTFAELLAQKEPDYEKWAADIGVCSELFEHYGILPYTTGRHLSEFFLCYMDDLKVQERFKLKRTTIADRVKNRKDAAKRIKFWTAGKATGKDELSTKPSRETAADIIYTISSNGSFSDVVNVPNRGQIPNLPMGAVVETMGFADAFGFHALNVGPLPDPIRATLFPHAEVQVMTVDAGLSGDLNAALIALGMDPLCAHLPVSDIRKMGMEMLRTNKKLLPQFRLR